MKICYSPYNKNAINQNKYIFQVTKAMKKSGFEIVNMRETFKNFKVFREVKIFNFNWYENIYEKNKLLAYIHFIKKVSLLYFFKMLNKKIIWTMHNKIPHDNNNEKLCLKLMKILAEKSDLIVTHCEESSHEISKLTKKFNLIKDKINNIEHPNYIDVYNDATINFKEKYNLKDDDLIFLFLGQIKPYKNIELIIQIAERFKDRNIKFIIAGKCVSDEYKNNLLNKINCNNVISIFKFITNEEMTSLIRLSDLLILPYDIRSSLNSGTAILAFSYKRTIICPKIGTLNDIKSYENIFSYNYINEKDHLEKLSLIIENIISKDGIKEELRLKGNNLFNIIKERHSLEIISEKYYKAYKKIID